MKSWRQMEDEANLWLYISLKKKNYQRLVKIFFKS